MDNQKINILLVDDDEMYISIIKFWLDAQGYSTKAVSSGEEALDVISKNIYPPTIIFLDINMPKMDGIETLRAIKQINKNIPVIMVTAYGSEKQHDEAKSLGVAGFFNKSSDFTHAAELIKRALDIMKKVNK